MNVDKELYSEIENIIIKWTIDGTKTAGHLTRQIIDLLTVGEPTKTVGVFCDNVEQFIEFKKTFSNVVSTSRCYFKHKNENFYIICRDNPCFYIHSRNFNDVIYLSELTEIEKNSEWFSILNSQICTD